MVGHKVDSLLLVTTYDHMDNHGTCQTKNFVCGGDYF